MEPFICENPECGKAITKFVGIPCAIVPEHIHRYCPECGINAECICSLPAMQEIYDLLYPWVGKKCSRCYRMLTTQDNVYSEHDIRTGEKHHYHHKCWDKGQQEMDAANRKIAEYKIVIPQPKESISFQE